MPRRGSVSMTENMSANSAPGGGWHISIVAEIWEQIKGKTERRERTQEVEEEQREPSSLARRDEIRREEKPSGRFAQDDTPC
jgi:hypothetical protein